jgi:ATP-dependent Clp protease ATP-binding subunit ClpA
LTDGKGETVYFAESLIIFTSNLGIYTEDDRGRRVPNITTDHNYKEMSERIMNEIRQFFNAKLNRPEILNRFGDNFVVFDFIRPDIDKLILVKVLKTIQFNLKKQKNCVFEFDDAFVELFRKLYVKDNLLNGGRGINNRVETHIKNEMVNFMFDQNKTENLNFRVFIDEANQNRVTFQCTGK